MAIFTITNGESTNLSVVKVTPIIQECFTLYEYIITTNNNDNITINLAGNHFEAIYKRNGLDISFNDDANFTYLNSLSVRFLLLNSGINSIFSSATITITNTTTGSYYDNFVQRDNDGANCYNAQTIPTKTSQLLNDGETGVNTYVENNEVVLLTTNQTVAGDKTFTGTTNTRNSTLLASQITMRNETQSQGVSLVSIGPNEGTWAIQGTGGADLSYDHTTNEFRIDTERILTTSDLQTIVTNAIDINFNSYLTLGSTNVQDVIQELKDELDTAIIGSFTLDTIPTNGSINGVESNGIFDALELKGNIDTINTWTALNIYNNGIRIGLEGLGTEFYSSGGNNIIDTKATALVIKSDILTNAWQFNGNGSLIGSSSSSLYSGIITTDYEAYSSGWNGNLSVPTKDAIYDKIETLGSSAISISGTPVDNQIAIWTNATTLEGTSGFTYDGSNFQLIGDIGSTGTRITKGWFSNLEVTNTIVGTITGNAGTVTSIGNLTGDITSINRATTISAGAVDIPMLSAGGTPSASTFLRGDNTWATPAGAGDVSKVGTPVNNQLGIWTGDGTIEGDSNITWNGSVLDITGTIDASINIISSLATLSGSTPLRIVGNSTGNANIGFIGFYESNNSVRKGFIGDASSSNSDIYVGADTGGIILSTGGATRYNVNSLGVHTFSGTSISSNVNIDILGSTTETKSLQIGLGRSDNGSSIIDLIGDATHTDYGLRIIRNNAGANSSSDIRHRGTNGLRFLAEDLGFIEFFTNNLSRLTIASNGVSTFTNDIIVPDEIYGIGWNGSTEVPTKNAIYDKIETVLSSIPNFTAKIYVAKISQTGTSAPTATIFENTSDGWTWSRTGIGIYRITPTGSYDLNKTHVLVTPDEQGSAETELVKIAKAPTYIQFAWYDNGILADGNMRLSLEIKQYP